ncbi:DUF1707 domain-containing protein [Dietzia aerolata]|uniref:DUF1707 SHOCT-like domain-containing protein n=1 Tax=Dietzia aerolata TaxID=595984 RepID=UPI0036377FFD
MDHGNPDPDRNVPAVRASDAERHETARILQEAFSEGRLTVAEFDERTSQAYQARFQTELAQLTVDISPPADPPPAASPSPSRICRPRATTTALRPTGSPDPRAPERQSP